MANDDTISEVESLLAALVQPRSEVGAVSGHETTTVYTTLDQVACMRLDAKKPDPERPPSPFEFKSPTYEQIASMAVDADPQTTDRHRDPWMSPAATLGIGSIRPIPHGERVWVKGHWRRR